MGIGPTLAAARLRFDKHNSTFGLCSSPNEPTSEQLVISRKFIISPCHYAEKKEEEEEGGVGSRQTAPNPKSLQSLELLLTSPSRYNVHLEEVKSHGKAEKYRDEIYSLYVVE